MVVQLTAGGRDAVFDIEQLIRSGPQVRGRLPSRPAVKAGGFRDPYIQSRSASPAADFDEQDTVVGRIKLLAAVGERAN
jgi:hypothetical protein